MRTVDPERLRQAFDFQARGCRGLGSELYARLLEGCLADLAHGTALATVVADWNGDPLRGFLPLRVLAGVHRRVLEGREPELAAFYPTTGGTPRFPDAVEAFLAVLARTPDALRPALASVPQTNEVNRCAGLLGGFLRAARATGLPLRLLEIGASAGLNLRWDRYRYVLGPHRWGDPASPVEVRTAWRDGRGGTGAAPDLGVSPRVERRLGCDLAPIDPADPEQAARLESFIWADQPERLARLRSAVAVARAVPAEVARAAAGDWLAARLAEPAAGVARVVYHSSVWMYVPETERARLRESLEAAGRVATADAPLAWLRLEDGDPLCELRLRLWPGGEEAHLGRAHPHCAWVEWYGVSRSR